MAHLHEVRDADTHFTIDAETMVITNTNAAKNKLRVGDHNSEVLTFEIPRYIENHDVLLCDKIGIHYMNAGTNKVDVSKDVYWVTDAAVSEEDENIVLFSWLVSGNATKYVGLLSFGIMFGCLEEDNTYSYVKNTEIFSGITISDGYNFTEAVVEQYSDVLEQLIKELEEDISQLSEDIADLKQNGTGSGTGWTNAQIDLLDEIGNYLPFTSGDGGKKWDDLIASLRGGASEEPDTPTDATVTSISATYTGGEVVTGTALSVLTGITVTATYSDGTTKVVTGYTLSGDIVEGENEITVSYNGFTTTFEVVGIVQSNGEDVTAELPIDGLVGYFDLRNVSQEKVGSAYLINATKGDGMLYSWYAMTETGDYGTTIKQSHYSNTTATTDYALGDKFTAVFMGYNGVFWDNNYFGNSIEHYAQLNAYYNNTNGSVTKLNVGNVKGVYDKTDYNIMILAVNGDTLNIYLNGTLSNTLHGSDYTDYSSWASILLPQLNYNTGYATAFALYNRALTEVELTETEIFFKTLEVA